MSLLVRERLHSALTVQGHVWQALENCYSSPQIFIHVTGFVNLIRIQPAGERTIPSAGMRTSLIPKDGLVICKTARKHGRGLVTYWSSRSSIAKAFTVRTLPSASSATPVALATWNQRQLKQRTGKFQCRVGKWERALRLKRSSYGHPLKSEGSGIRRDKEWGQSTLFWTGSFITCSWARRESLRRKEPTRAPTPTKQGRTTTVSPVSWGEMI